MYGIVLDMYSGTSPFRVSATGTLRNLRRRETINPEHTAANWPRGQVTNIERTTKRSTAGGPPLDGWIVERTGP